MNETKQRLILAEQKAKELFYTVEERGLIVSGKSEAALCEEIVKIAREDFGIENHWSKKIVRTGISTLQPFMANPPDLIIQEDDILFFDFHPIFEGWEADLGRTYVLGDDPLKQRIQKDVEAAWREGNSKRRGSGDGGSSLNRISFGGNTKSSSCRINSSPSWGRCLVCQCVGVILLSSPFSVTHPGASADH